MAERSARTRVTTSVLVGVGTFALAVAILVPGYAAGALKKYPLDVETTTVSTGTGSVLDASSISGGQRVRIDQNVPLVSQKFVTAEEPSNSDKITLQSGETLRRTDRQGDTGLLSALVDRVTLDRSTCLPTDPSGSIQAVGNKPAKDVVHDGVTYKLPFDTERTTYKFFDVRAAASFDLTYVEDTEVNGLPVYKFTETTPPTDLSKSIGGPTDKLALPADTWGVPGGAAVITMTRFFTSTREIYVEPKTGVIVKGDENVHAYYARRAETPEVDALKATIGFDANTVENAVATARDGIDQISLATRVVPIVSGIIALLTLLGAAYLWFFRHRPPPAPAQPVATYPIDDDGPGDPDAPTEVFPSLDLRK